MNELSTGPLDLLLINAPVHDYASFPRYSSTHTAPLGLLSIATVLDEAGFSVDVFDAELNQASPQRIKAEVLERAPTWVGINTFSINTSVVAAIAEHLRGLEPRLVIGGPHATNVSNAQLRRQFPSADLVVRGDGEFVMRELLKGSKPSSLAGVVELDRDDSDFTVATLDLAELPTINRKFSKGEPVHRLGGKWFSMTMSRGCLFRCAFCAGSSFFNGIPYRSESPSRRISEIEILTELGATGIRLIDDLPFKGKHALIEFLESVRSYEIDWDINFPLQYCRSLSRDDWENIAGAGVATLTFGVEAGTPDLRASLGKKITDAQLWSVVSNAQRVGIGLKVYFLIGSPGETVEETESTINLALQLANLHGDGRWTGIECSVFAYKPMPGSKLWNELLASHSEGDLLQYLDFELTVTEFQKHSWRSDLQLAELPPDVLAERIDDYYRRSRRPDPLGATLLDPLIQIAGRKAGHAPLHTSTTMCQLLQEDPP